jgi:hypothetical protein
MHAYKMHAGERHTYKMHASEMHTYKMYAGEIHTHEVHAGDQWSSLAGLNRAGLEPAAR